MAMRRGGMLAAMTVAMLALAACTPQPGSAPAGNDPEPSSEVVAEGLEAPWSIVFHDGIPLVSERDSGRVLELGDDGAVREVAVIDGVAGGGEGGLLGLAVHGGDLYTYFTAADGNRIESREILGDPGALALGPPTTVFDGIPSAGTHNGGRIAFGPDGMLYVTAGDAGDRDSAQDRDALSGKILRLTPDGDVPDDNPFDGSPVYSYGHRNPQGIAWDAAGTMYASEFGQDTWDELNVIEAGGNYGWPAVEGIAGDEDYIDPVQQWAPSDASPSGIAVLGDRIVIANLRGERLRVVPLDDLATSSEWFRGEVGRLRDAVVAPDGSLWIVTNNTDGRGDPADGDDRILRLDVG
ncbi:PQQ-dependent sugar dehydrogenase [Microbacterium sp. LWO12-1.2]|uniref:PQQ-dependent sugar dehydrogenase n=1 Tax=Microbacterium sp. LWO12-1.2 TaxID=3135261 RepID=UPI0039C8E1E7